MKNLHHRVALLLAVCTSALLGACAGPSNVSSINPAHWMEPYKVPVVQGNFVSREQLASLRRGMSRVQVREALGTPLVASVFHADRWDYVFTLNRQNTEPQFFKLTVFFKDDELERFAGDDMPGELDFIAKLDTNRKFEKPPVLELSGDALKAIETTLGVLPTKLPTVVKAPLAALPTNYPPLESASR